MRVADFSTAQELSARLALRRFVDLPAYRRDGEFPDPQHEKKDPKRSAAGRKAIQTMRRKAGDAYLSRLGKKAAATKRRKRKK